MSKSQLRIAVLFMFFSILLVSAHQLELRNGFSLEKIRLIIENHSLTGFLMFIVLFTLGNFIQVPGLVFLAAAVITLGKTYGGLVTYSAAVVSCSISFVIIRFLGGDILRQLKYSWTTKVFNQLDENPIRSVFILRTVFQTLPLLNYGLALSGISFRNHFIGTITALPLPLFLYCVFFESIATLLGISI